MTRSASETFKMEAMLKPIFVLLTHFLIDLIFFLHLQLINQSINFVKHFKQQTSKIVSLGLK